MNTLRYWQGYPHPLRVTWDGEGMNVALYSEHSEKLEFCFFDSKDPWRNIACLRLTKIHFAVSILL